SSLRYDEEGRAWAREMKLRVREREMPPNHDDADAGIQEQKQNKRQSGEEIERAAWWVGQGVAEGDTAELPPPVEFPQAGEWQLAKTYGEPDVVIRSEPYTVPKNGSDLWWQPVVPTGLTEDRCIRAIETRPSVEGRSVTHHANSSFMIQDENGQLQRAAR